MKFISNILVFCLFMLLVSSCSAQEPSEFKTKELTSQQLAELETAYFAAGCFWCVEAIYQQIEGVKQAVSGFSGGEKENPSYREVSMGQTHYAETVRVRYDSDVVTYRQLVQVFYASHNPTLLNKVGPDEGEQYRSAIFYINEHQQQVAIEVKNKIDASDRYDEPIVTEIMAFQSFWPASEHHQNYEQKHPDDPYVVSVSQPRIKRTLAQFPELVKEEK